MPWPFSPSKKTRSPQIFLGGKAFDCNFLHTWRWLRESDSHYFKHEKQKEPDSHYLKIESAYLSLSRPTNFAMKTTFFSAFTISFPKLVMKLFTIPFGPWSWIKSFNSSNSEIGSPSFVPFAFKMRSSILEAIVWRCQNHYFFVDVKNSLPSTPRILQTLASRKNVLCSILFFPSLLHYQARCRRTCRLCRIVCWKQIVPS